MEEVDIKYETQVMMQRWPRIVEVIHMHFQSLPEVVGKVEQVIIISEPVVVAAVAVVEHVMVMVVGMMEDLRYKNHTVVGHLMEILVVVLVVETVLVAVAVALVEQVVVIITKLTDLVVKVDQVVQDL